MSIPNPPSMMSRFGAKADARAVIRGGAGHRGLFGYADFFAHGTGTFVLCELWGLPHDAAPCAENIYAMHIHSNGSCAGNMETPFSAAGGHFDRGNCPHPAHTGDLPPLFGNRGYALQGVYTERFTVREIIGRAVIIHARRDDFTTQPAGDAGGRIACGVIERRTPVSPV